MEHLDGIYNSNTIHLVGLYKVLVSSGSINIVQKYEKEHQLPWYAAQWMACLSFLSLACTLAPLPKSKLTICKNYKFGDLFDYYIFPKATRQPSTKIMYSHF